MYSCHQDSSRNNSFCGVGKIKRSSKSSQLELGKEKRESLKLNEINLPSFSAAPVPDYVRVLMVTDVNGRTKQLHVPASLDLERPKRPRTTFTEKQVEALELEFLDNHFVSQVKRQRLSAYLNLSQTQIKVWYQNRRSKCHRLGCTHHKGSVSSSSLAPFLQTVDEGHMSWARKDQHFGNFPQDLKQHLGHFENIREKMKTKEKLACASSFKTVYPTRGGGGGYPWSLELVQSRI